MDLGQENDALLSYLEDNERFADLFNQLYFMGRRIVKPQDLEEASEVYHGEPGKSQGQRTRDIKKRLKSGKELKLLATEAQREVNYIMPWRIMDYDCREYGRQIARIRRQNRKAEQAGEKDVYANAAERLCEVRKDDRIAPVYTLCLYHGTESWDGPKSLKDMMDFGENLSEEEREEWERHFADYPMRLVCANEPIDCTGFQTSLGHIIALLPYRKDKKRLKELLDNNPAYQRMDKETARTMSILIGIRKFEEKEERYKTGKEYNMCQAMMEMLEDSKLEGKEEGREEGEAKKMISMIDNMLKNLHCTLEEACRITGEDPAEYRRAKALV